MTKRLGDTVSVVAVTLVTKLIAFIVTIMSARALGATEFGRLATLLASIGLAGLVADFGTSERAVQQASRGEHLLESALAARATLGLVVAFLILALGTLWGRGLSIAVLVAAGSVAILTITSNAAARDRVRGRPIPAAGWVSLAALAPAAGGAVGAAIKPTLPASALGVLVGSSIAAAAAIAHQSAQIRFSKVRESGKVAWDARHLAVTAICVALYSRGDRLVLSVIAGPRELGSYTAFYSLVFGFSLLGPSIAWTTMPMLARTSDESTWRTLIVGRMNFATRAAVASGATFAITSKFIIKQTFGPEFDLGWPAVAGFSVLVSLYIVNPLMAAAIVSIGDQLFLGRTALINASVALLIFPCSAFVAGATGMVFASALLELIGLCLLGSRLRARVKFSGTLSPS